MSNTFMPDVYYQPFKGPKVELDDIAFWKHYRGVRTPYVVIITSGAATASPGKVDPTPTERAAADAGSGRDGLAVFIGGTAYTVTDDEKTILEAAGYTVTSS